ncbi:DNA-binding protein [Escherichia coli]|nr:DNA-binding protein [Escherichia coli]
MINYLTAKDAAEYLGVCLSRFYQLKRYIRSFPPYINVTNGAIVIHTQRLKSDPGGNLLS